ncbi:hypothetical protein HNP38_001211 [Chryseobacterium defluvii]|uniref:Uncharacterized protein n=1 Tax=Chryseobacterium defluvii TaxID=160396 RepID=A0A840K9D1_9FLAO|nr:helix-turn-helix domain-containing protein [Chryseobacterium defluvii]MBB4805939.1 hypothetical protein [Chryseobacterium defluvii]
MKPDYRQIYTDILTEKYPEKIQDQYIKHKIEHINNVMDILTINALIFGKHNHEPENQKLRSYDKSSILIILDYQRKNQMNNSQIANHFRLSRNTIAKWKKIYV